MKVFVVTMYRWGDEESHSYVIGVFTLRTEAEHAAKDEREWRGGKYEGGIRELVLNEMYDRKADIEATAEKIKAACSSTAHSSDCKGCPDCKGVTWNGPGD